MAHFNDYKDFLNSFTSQHYTDEEKLEFRSMINSANIYDSEELTPSILKGQYRMSYHLLQRLFRLRTKNLSIQSANTKKHIHASGKPEYEYKITKMELLLLILLLQMCDANNHIHDFSYSKDIAVLKDCHGDSLFKKSTCYHVLNSLERKKIITRKEQDNGMITLSIPANQINKNEKYISLQTEFLLHDSEQYLAFRDMKLAAMKIYLLCLATTYQGKNASGTAVLNSSPQLSVDDIKTKIGVKQNRTIRTYIKSLEKTFGKLSFIPGGGRKAFSKGKLQMSNAKNNYCFSKRTTMSDTQPNSFRRHFDKAIHTHDISYDRDSYSRMRTWAFMLIEARNDLGTEKLFSFIIDYLSSHKMDMLSMAEIGRIIANA